METTTTPTRVIVVGFAPAGMGYPNAASTVNILKASDQFKIIDYCRWDDGQNDFWGLSQFTLKRVTRLVAITWWSALSVVKTLLKERGGQRVPTIVYFPYPSLAPLLIWSFLPRRHRSFIVCDAYISVYDSAFEDRKISDSSLLAKLFYKLEKRCFQAADRVFVDTQRNEERLACLFNLDLEKIASCPIALPESQLRQLHESAQHNPINNIDVLFFGAISPLHGIDTLLEAFDLASRRRNLSITIVGDGQSGNKVAEFMASRHDGNIEWIRPWQPPKKLVEIIAASRVLIGMFGGSDKAKSVLPLKAYIGLCLGKPIINQSEFSWPSSAPKPPLLTCQNDPESLAEEILEILSDADRLEQQSCRSKSYFDAHLGRQNILYHWLRITKRANIE